MIQVRSNHLKHVVWQQMYTDKPIHHKRRAGCFFDHLPGYWWRLLVATILYNQLIVNACTCKKWWPKPAWLPPDFFLLKRLILLKVSGWLLYSARVYGVR